MIYSTRKTMENIGKHKNTHWKHGVEHKQLNKHGKNATQTKVWGAAMRGQTPRFSPKQSRPKKSNLRQVFLDPKTEHLRLLRFWVRKKKVPYDSEAHPVGENPGSPVNFSEHP